VQRPAHLAALAFGVEVARDSQRVGVGRDDGAGSGTGAVEALDAVQGCAGDAYRARRAGFHLPLQAFDAAFDQCGLGVGEGGCEQRRGQEEEGADHPREYTACN
jgi:hypothetical protein